VEAIGQNNHIGRFDDSLEKQIKLHLFSEKTKDSMHFKFLKAYVNNDISVYEHLFSWGYN